MHELDSEIDIVARELTSTSAPDLRARVLAQVDERPARRPLGWLVPVGVAAAVVVVALVVVRRGPVETPRGVGNAVAANAIPQPPTPIPHPPVPERQAPRPHP